MDMSTEHLITLLANGEPQHIAELAHTVHCTPQQLNVLWQRAPAHIRPLLRQQDGIWRLNKSLAIFPCTPKIDGFNCTLLPETESTNTVLLQEARQGQPIHQRVIIAHNQTHARGRQGKTWFNRWGECLMFSVGWTFKQEQAQLGSLALVVALACQRALVQCQCPAQIKWPNDLVIGMDKLGGILIETLRKEHLTHAVIGIGINFLLPEKTEQTTAFQAACKQKINVETLFSCIMRQLDILLTQFCRDGFAPFQTAYEQAHRDQNQYIYLLQEQNISQSGHVLGVTEHGALRLNTYEGEKHIISAHTSLRRSEQLIAQQTPSHHYLLLDGGNSRLKWAWVKNGQIVHKSHAPYRDLSHLQTDWQTYRTHNTRIVGAAVCSLAKREMVAQTLQHPVQWLGSMQRALGIINHYRYPSEHGADRWFNVLGSRNFTTNACIIISCGTAVTIDALTQDNHYLGGSIMPGFHLMRESLVQKTAQLQHPEGQYYAFPTTTANAIATGMLDAVCGAIVLMHARLKERTPNQIVDIIITGGGAHKIMETLPRAFTLDNTVKIVDNLVIIGLLNWIEQK